MKRLKLLVAAGLVCGLMLTLVGTASAADTACNQATVRVAPGTGCVSLITTANQKWCLSSRGQYTYVQLERCNIHAKYEEWEVIEPDPGKGHAELWNVGESCPNNLRYSSCAMPIEGEAYHADLGGYGYCAKLETGIPYADSRLVMAQCSRPINVDNAKNWFPWEWQPEAGETIDGHKNLHSLVSYINGSATSENKWLLKAGRDAAGAHLGIGYAHAETGHLLLSEGFYGQTIAWASTGQCIRQGCGK